MRRTRSIPSAIALALASLAACSSTIGPSSPEPLSNISPGAGVETSQTRAAVVGFLNAYASAGDDEAASVQKLVDPLSPAGLWATVLRVQDHEFQGSISGSLKIASIGAPSPPAAAAQGTPSQQLRIVQVQASVDLTFSPGGGQPIQQTRTFDGPMALLESAPGRWEVVDFTRDGQPLDNILAPLGSALHKGGVTLHLIAEVLDPQAWELLVAIENGATSTVTMGQGSVFLATGPTSVVATGSITKNLASVDAGARETGLVSVPAQTSAPGGLVYVIVVDPAKGKPIPFVLSVDKLQQAIASQTGASPTPAPSATSGPFG